MTTHTPGPWRVDASCISWYVYPESGHWVATGALPHDIWHKPPHVVERSEHMANARLIAAAPDYATAAALAITALSSALEQATRDNDFAAILQYSTAKDALIAADNKRKGVSYG